MLKSVPQYHKLGFTEVFCMFCVPHVVLRVCYNMVEG
jgi:hypothetical protein